MIDTRAPMLPEEMRHLMRTGASAKTVCLVKYNRFLYAPNFDAIYEDTRTTGVDCCPLCQMYLVADGDCSRCPLKSCGPMSAYFLMIVNLENRKRDRFFSGVRAMIRQIRYTDADALMVDAARVDW